MSFLGKLKFWKKEEDLDFDTLANKELGRGESPPFGEMDAEQRQRLGLNEPSALEQPGGSFGEPLGETGLPGRASASPYAGTGASFSGKDRELELINSKLDTIKAMLASLEQRMVNLEKSSGKDQKIPQHLW